MRIANEAKLNAIMARSNNVDLLARQDPGGLSKQEQRTDAVQDYIQHDPSRWAGPSIHRSGGFQETGMKVALRSVVLPWGSAKAAIRIP